SDALLLTSRKPSRQLGHCGVQPSSRLIFAFDTPRISFITVTKCSPISSRAIQAGTWRGGCACAQSARNDSHSETGAGSSSATLYTPPRPDSTAAAVAPAASSMCTNDQTPSPSPTSGSFLRRTACTVEPSLAIEVCG